MDTKRPEALALANTALQVRNKDTPDDVYVALGDCAWALRNLHAENERLRIGYDATRHEIANLQARVQELGQMARDVNSRRVIELEALLAAVGAGGVEPLRKRCLHKISEPVQPVGWAIFAENGNGLMWTQSRQNAEVTAKDIGLQVTPLYAAPQPAAPAQAGEQNHLPLAITSAPERIWLDLGVNPCEEDAHFSNLHDLTWSQDNATGDGIEYVRADLAARGAAQAAPVDAAKDASARFKAQHEFLVWNREQTPPPIESATEYSVFNQAVDFYIAARAAQGGANG